MTNGGRVATPARGEREKPRDTMIDRGSKKSWEERESIGDGGLFPKTLKLHLIFLNSHTKENISSN